MSPAHLWCGEDVLAHVLLSRLVQSFRGGMSGTLNSPLFLAAYPENLETDWNLINICCRQSLHRRWRGIPNRRLSVSISLTFLSWLSADHTVNFGTDR